MNNYPVGEHHILPDGRVVVTSKQLMHGHHCCQGCTFLIAPRICGAWKYDVSNARCLGTIFVEVDYEKG